MNKPERVSPQAQDIEMILKINMEIVRMNQMIAEKILNPPMNVCNIDTFKIPSEEELKSTGRIKL